MEGPPQSEQLFPVEREYVRCLAALNRTGILTLLPKSESIGVIGTDGKEYPIPTQEQVVELFAHNRELVGRKVPQRFDRLELTLMPDATAEVITKKAMQWLSQINIKDDNYFLIMLFFDVHWPYHPPEKFASMLGENSQDFKYGDWQFRKQFNYQENPLVPEIKKNSTAINLNYVSIGIEIPCYHLGYGNDPHCYPPHRISSQVLIIEANMIPGRMMVVLVGEELCYRSSIVVI